jgi:malate dehydrogenase (oxaloacetate-decarboxylating)(NADP+)
VISKGVQTEVMNPSSSRPFAVETDAKTLAEAMKGADVFVGLSLADLVTPEMLKEMNEGPLVLALANPDPEIPYDVARATRPDAICGTGARTSRIRSTTSWVSPSSSVVPSTCVRARSTRR